MPIDTQTLHFLSHFSTQVNPSNAEATFIQNKDFEKPYKLGHVGIT